MYRFEWTVTLCLVCLFNSSACRSNESAVGAFTYPASYDLGEPISATTRSQLFTTIPPDGSGLPDGSGTYASGKWIYEVKCMACHGDKMQGTDVGMPLLGGRGSLVTAAPKKTVESYWPYATSVFSYVRNTMPVSAPGTLTNDEVYALMAYLLGSAGIVPEDIAMDKNVLTDVEMPNRQGFIRDDRPDIEPDPDLYPTTSRATGP